MILRPTFSEEKYISDEGGDFFISKISFDLLIFCFIVIFSEFVISNIKS